MKQELDLRIIPNMPFNLRKHCMDDSTFYEINMMLNRQNIEKLRGYKWDFTPFISVNKFAVANDKDLALLNELIEIISIGTSGKLIHTEVTNTSAIEKIICNNYPTVETYFEQLPLLKKGKTNYWYLASSKDGIKVGIDEYVKAIRKYTGDNAWHVSDITEHDKQNVVYEFTNTYDDLYY